MAGPDGNASHRNYRRRAQAQPDGLYGAVRSSCRRHRGRVASTWLVELPADEHGFDVMRQIQQAGGSTERFERTENVLIAVFPASTRQMYRAWIERHDDAPKTSGEFDVWESNAGAEYRAGCPIGSARHCGELARNEKDVNERNNEMKPNDHVCIARRLLIPVSASAPGGRPARSGRARGPQPATAAWLHPFSLTGPRRRKRCASSRGLCEGGGVSSACGGVG